QLALSIHQSLYGRELEARKDLAKLLPCPMALQNWRKDIPIVGSHRKIARPFEDLARQAGPFAMDFPSIHPAAENKHHAPASMIGAEGRVLLHAPPEFSHHDNRGCRELWTEVARKRSEAFRQPTHQRIHNRCLAKMGIPSTQINRSGLQACP